jgi:hypothetical protein
LSKLCTIPNANTWTLITLPNLPVWPGGGNFTTAPGSQGYLIIIALAAGTSLLPPANDTWQSIVGGIFGAVGQSNFAASPVNSTFDLAFVQHEPGPVCTTPIDIPFNQNLESCQRFFQKTYAYNVLPGTATAAGLRALLVQAATSVAYGPVNFSKIMAAIPTMTAYNWNTGAINSIQDTAGVVHTGPAFNFVGDSGFSDMTFTGATTAAMGIYVQYTADTGW